jgi:flagellar biosynthesis/type III secretory pathway chaperone
MRHEQSNALIDLLVQEFRSWQALLQITLLERRLLVEGDAPGLTLLAPQKTELLARLTEHQQERQQRIHRLASPQTPGPFCESSFSIQTLLDGLGQQEAESLLRIAEGIQAIAEIIGELTQGNFVMADCTMRRYWSLQVWIGQENHKSLPSLLGSVLAARQVLSSNTPTNPPSWSRPMEILDQELFNAQLAARIYGSPTPK